MRRHAIRIALVVIAFAAAAAIAIGDVVRRAAARRLREAILAELQPVVLKNCTVEALRQRQRWRIPDVRESD